MTHAESEAAFAAAVVDPGAPPPQGLAARSPEAAASRFAVYRNTVAVGLVNALGARFPTVAQLVGEAYFRAVARAYVGEAKPRTPLLIDYGDEFPDFLARFEVAAGLPYLSDVARLEVAVSRAYHAADDAVLAPAALSAMAPDDLGATRLERHSAAAVVASDHPIGSIWAAHRRTPVEPVADWSAEAVLVTRPGEDVRVLRLAPADAAFVAAALAGETLFDAAGRAIALDPAFDFGRALVGALSAGAFTSLSTVPEIRS